MKRNIPMFLLSLILCGAVNLLAAEAVVVVPETSIKGARQPQVAIDSAGKVFIAFGAEDRVYCVASDDGGRSYQQPVQVGQLPRLALGMRRGPRIATAGTAVVVTAISHGNGNLFAWRSTDGGKTWQAAQTINRVEGSAREGLHALTASAQGRLYAVWLDMRANKGQEVFGAACADGGATWQAEQLIYASPDEGICPCCQPSAAFDPTGGLHVMWRNDVSGSRDMYLASSRDAGGSFGEATKLGQGSWLLDSCPMDGGGLAGNSSGLMQTIWRRNKELFRCTPGEREISLGKGEQGWAASGAAGVPLVWLTARPGALMALIPGWQQPRKIADQAIDPVIASSSQGTGPMIIAWEEGAKGKTVIRAAVLP